ncbi:MAG: hypothetical protein IBX72_13535 [Nitrospirae bacterium]|nr:hypothetical protein [Nitrospirota bacterium]
MNENIDVKKLKGKWAGYHRIRFGKVRIILNVNFEERRIYVDTIDYRGNDLNFYKKIEENPSVKELIKDNLF